MNNNVFISYRRIDSTLAAFWIEDILKKTFNNINIFIDTESVESGESFPETLSEALERAGIILVLIGKSWLKTYDQYGRRRIDNPNDWIRREIKTSLDKGTMILPILIGESSLPEKEAIPGDISKLVDFQALNLRESQWLKDVKELINRLKDLGLDHKGTQIQYPRPTANLKSLSKDNIDLLLRKLPDWKLVYKDDLSGNHRLGIQRIYQFKSFEDSIHFMSTAARRIQIVNHHPEWENIWNSVSVWLTSWDIGHKPTMDDFELAEYLDQLFISYQ